MTVESMEANGGRWKCLKRCSIAKRLPCTMSILLQFFSGRHISRIKDFVEKCKLVILKKSSKKGDRFTATSDLRNNEDAFYFELGIGTDSIKSFQSKFIVPRYLEYSCIKGQGHSCFSEINL